MAEPHAALGFVKTHYEWDWAGAERESRRALELDPNYANGHFWHVHWLKIDPRFDRLRADVRFTSVLRRMGLEP